MLKPKILLFCAVYKPENTTFFGTMTEKMLLCCIYVQYITQILNLSSLISFPMMKDAFALSHNVDNALPDI